MTPSELYYFIGNCLAMDEDPEARQQVEYEVSSGNVSWEDFVWMGSCHFVLPALFSAFRRNGILNLLPDDLTEHLSSIYDINLNRNLQIIEQSHELIHLLNKAGIEPIFLKGAGHLLQNLYHDPGDRIMSDIDILLPENELHEAAQVLYENGYSHPEKLKNDNFEKHHHLPGFEHNNKVAMVEIHQSVFPHHFQKILSNAEIFSNKKKIEGLDAWVLSVNHQQVLNFVHDQLVDDDFKYKTMLIKGLYDFYLLANLKLNGDINPLAKGYNRTFNTYCSHVSSVFNNSKAVNFTDNRTTRKFKTHFNFLLNHPKIYGLYQFSVLYSIRIPIIVKSFVTAPFSKHSRRFIRKKIGSLEAARHYFQNLKREI